MADFSFVAGEIPTATQWNARVRDQLVISCTSSTRPATPVDSLIIHETNTRTLLEWISATSSWCAIGTTGRWTSSSRPAISATDAAYEGLRIFETDTGLAWVARRTTLGTAISGGNPLIWVPGTAGGRITLANASMTNPTLATFNAGITDIPGATLTFTAPVAGDYTVNCDLNFTATKAGTGAQPGGTLWLTMDGSLGASYHDFLVDPAGGRRFQRLQWRGSLTAGSHTVKVQGSGISLTAFNPNGYSAQFEVLSSTRN